MKAHKIAAIALTGAALTALAARLVQREAALRQQLARQKQTIRRLEQDSHCREEMRRQFTANVSHELKTPLTTISGTAELLLSGMVRAEDVPHFAGNIYQEARRMNTLVNDILKLSQLEEGKTIAEKAPVDLLEVCRDTAHWLSDEAQRRQITLHVSGTPACIIGERKVLDEMVGNLCVNSIKYNKAGGNVWIRVEPAMNRVVLTVQDDGIGIPAEHQGRVFERFYRVDKSHSRQIGGTGLGLSIVKHGAIFHNAEIELESREGVGTTIQIRFPAPANPA